MRLREILPGARINPEIPSLENLSNYKPLTARDYGCMAELSYNLTPLPKGGGKLKDCQTREGDHIPLSTDFYIISKRSFWSFSGFSCFRIARAGQRIRIELIIAHTGTDDWYDRIYGWISIAVTHKVFFQHTGFGKELTDASLKYMGINSTKCLGLSPDGIPVEFKVTHVGHSLGGAISNALSEKLKHQWIGFDVPYTYLTGYGEPPEGISISAHNYKNSLVSWTRLGPGKQRTGYTQGSYKKYNIELKHSMPRILIEQFDDEGNWREISHEDYHNDKIAHEKAIAEKQKYYRNKIEQKLIFKYLMHEPERHLFSS